MKNYLIYFNDCVTLNVSKYTSTIQVKPHYLKLNVIEDCPIYRIQDVEVEIPQQLIVPAFFITGTFIYSVYQC